jgi:hypothetical protein
MRLDELGVEVQRPPLVRVSARGVPSDTEPAGRSWLGREEGHGASALATLEKVNENVAQGHTHRQALVFHTRWIGGRPLLLTAVEAGTMALMEQSTLGLRESARAGRAAGPSWKTTATASHSTSQRRTGSRQVARRRIRLGGTQ